MEWVLDKSVIDCSLLDISLFNCVGFSNVGFSNVGFSNVGLSNVGFSNVGKSDVGGCSLLVAASGSLRLRLLVYDIIRTAQTSFLVAFPAADDISGFFKFL